MIYTSGSQYDLQASRSTLDSGTWRNSLSDQTNPSTRDLPGEEKNRRTHSLPLGIPFRNRIAKGKPGWGLNEK